MLETLTPCYAACTNTGSLTNKKEKWGEELTSWSSGCRGPSEVGVKQREVLQWVWRCYEHGLCLSVGGRLHVWKGGWQ